MTTNVIATYVIAVALIMAILAGWIIVQHLSRRFAARHPEYGRQREHMGCGLACSCTETCDNDDKTKKS